MTWLFVGGDWDMYVLRLLTSRRQYNFTHTDALWLLVSK